jgi:uncharacterized RDD family membrane protein YckC
MFLEKARFPLSTSSQRAEILSAESSTVQAVPAWKEELNARLSAHRSRRPRVAEGQQALPGLENAEAESHASRVAARVAERYSKAPSYSEMLAAEAANAARAAEVAVQAAQEVRASAQAILAGLDIEMSEARAQAAFSEAAAAEHLEVEDLNLEEMETRPIEVRQPEPIRYQVNQNSLPRLPQSPVLRQPERPAISKTSSTEIVDPFEEATVVPSQPLPAKLLEFPRELVAPRKARPRLAEGPLRDSETEPEKSQLRIFEVESEAISKEPVVEAVLPEWHAIRLDDSPRSSSQPQPSRPASQPPATVFDLPLHTAPLEDRVMAGVVDLALVIAAFLLFVLVFVACTAHPPTGKAALVGAGIALGALFLLYQWLFFNYSEATPGMRYARIALCTFDDENPDRITLRGRIAALLLSVLPLGLGFVWCFFDEDHLSWHDRITRTYQRSYR